MQETRFEPWPGKIPYALEQLKSVCQNYWSLGTLESLLLNKRNHGSKKPVRHNERVAPSCCDWWKPHAAMKTQHDKNK